ncbi:hypothetical protein BDY21DRAFT_352003 [Lineolata rhizophorae]|uniref:Uncharacterized protein n=1 Tax=Lineolata rhizophorae TaxID=578093 RepID=A0A6A6NT74_9PEZI|nr:hypothetical protein BDY21DRAFT_352003 [Lineolata rhizophorae]
MPACVARSSLLHLASKAAPTGTAIRHLKKKKKLWDHSCSRGAFLLSEVTIIHPPSYIPERREHQRRRLP